jgi:hypothetical protein
MGYGIWGIGYGIWNMGYKHAQKLRKNTKNGMKIY